MYVLEGNPDVWINGEIYRLDVGSAVAFEPGTGIAHTFLNNTKQNVRLLVVGERLTHNKCFYPLQPEGWEGMPEGLKWKDPPQHTLGTHDGLPDLLRNRLKGNL